MDQIYAQAVRIYFLLNNFLYSTKKESSLSPPSPKGQGEKDKKVEPTEYGRANRKRSSKFWGSFRVGLRGGLAVILVQIDFQAEHVKSENNMSVVKT